MTLVRGIDLGNRAVLADAGRVAIWGISPQTLNLGFRGFGLRASSNSYLGLRVSVIFCRKENPNPEIPKAKPNSETLGGPNGTHQARSKAS